MKPILSIYLISIYLLFGVSFSALSRDQIPEFEEDVCQVIRDFEGTDGKQNLPLAACLVRLVFHDCAGPVNTGRDGRSANNRARKCDGCVNMDLPDHAGLQRGCIEPIAELFGRWASEFEGKIGDFWIAAAQAAIRFTQSLDTDNECDSECQRIMAVPYTFGREDCPTAPKGETNAETTWPQAHMGWDHLHEFLQDFFDFDDDDSTAYLGAHTLGHCHESNSGFKGKWTNKPHVFNNEFYQQIEDNKKNQWDQVKAPNGKQMFVNRGVDGKLTMLNADYGLKWRVDEGNADFNSDTGMCECRGEDWRLNSRPVCREEVSHSIVTDFAKDNTFWLKKFWEAWFKVIRKNQPRNLVSVTPGPFTGCSKPAEKPTPKPVAAPKPTPKPVAAPKPTPKPVSAPKPTPKPVGAPKPKPTPKPVSAPKPTPKPVSSPVSKPSNGNGNGGRNGGKDRPTKCCSPFMCHRGYGYSTQPSLSYMNYQDVTRRECCEYCSNDDKCMGWTFESENDHCYLFTDEFDIDYAPKCDVCVSGMRMYDDDDDSMSYSTANGNGASYQSPESYKSVSTKESYQSPESPESYKSVSSVKESYKSVSSNGKSSNGNGNGNGYSSNGKSSNGNGNGYSSSSSSTRGWNRGRGWNRH